MIVLGLTDGITCGAAIVRDGEIIAAVNDEALTRLKMAYGFPRASIAEVMRLAGVKPSELDHVAVATNNNYFFDGIRPWAGWFQRDKGLIRDTVFQVVSRLAPLVELPGVEQLYYTARTPVFVQRRSAIRRILRKEFGIQADVQFINHHLAHATSAYFTSGFDNATVVSIDGGGDGDSSHIYRVEGGRFRRTGHTSAFNSLGNFYSYVTHICGFTAQKHEGKITGLAAHGEPRYLDVLDSLITLENGELKNIGKAVFASGVKAIVERLPSGWTREDLAASIQVHSERLAVGYIRHHLGTDTPTDLAIAGGVCANVRINQEISEIPGVSRTFVHPGMSDAGLGVGAALAFCMANRKVDRMTARRTVIENVYYGAGFSESEIEAALRAQDLEFTKPASIEAEVAHLLAAGHVVARFNGRMEYGPRALGNRTILYQPGDRAVNDWLNTLLKRTEFMPFAPSTLMDHADDCYHGVDRARDAARFMTVTFDCTKKMAETCHGVIHIDNTARPQLVRAQDNPSYYKLIDEFRKLTGVPTVINTSFNMHEEPIVYSPDDAIRAFRQGHLDYLAIGDFLVPSPEPIRHNLVPMERVAVGA